MAVNVTNFVKHTAAAPGNSASFTLGAASAPFSSFSFAYATGDNPYVLMYDGTQWEMSHCIFTEPDQLGTRTVISNSAGTGSRLNFAGTTTVVNTVPAEKIIYLVPAGYAQVSGNIRIQASGILYPADNVTGLSILGQASGVSGSGVTFYGQNGGAGSTPEQGFVLLAGGSEMARVDSSRDMQIGTTTKRDTARVTLLNNGINANISSGTVGTSNTPHIVFNNASGTTQVGSIYTNGSTTTYNTTSDYRLKTDHGPYTGDLIASLRVHDAEFVIDGARYPMFIAHELQEDGAGFCVQGEKDGEQMQGVDTSKLIPALVSYCQRLEARIAALEAA